MTGPFGPKRIRWHCPDCPDLQFHFFLLHAPGRGDWGSSMTARCPGCGQYWVASHREDEGLGASITTVTQAERWYVDQLEGRDPIPLDPGYRPTVGGRIVPAGEWGEP